MKKLLAALLLAASAAVPSFAVSGEIYSSEVTIKPTPYVAGRTRATGTLMAARNSNDKVQYIGCRAAQEIAYCYARDKSGKTFMCSTGDPDFMVAMGSVSASSQILVDVEVGNCKNLEVTNMSSYIAEIQAPVVSPGPVVSTPVGGAAQP